MMRIVNAVRMFWLIVRRDIAAAEVRSLRAAGLHNTETIREYYRQIDDYNREIAQLEERHAA